MVSGQWSAVRFTRFLKILVILAFTIFAIVACSKQKTSREGIVIADSDKYEATIYRQNCAICHGKEAYGKMMDGKPVPSLRFGDIEKKTEEEIYQQIVNGKLPMPSFENQLAEKEIRKMVKFIMYDLQGREKIKDKQKNQEETKK